jgi:single-strand DNA-binding protein
MNVVNLIGRLTRDPELRSTQGGTSVCEMRLAGKTRRGEAMFVNVTAFGKQAEACAKYLAKGSQVGVSGELRYEEWKVEEQKRSAHLIVADLVDFLDSKPEAESESKPKASRRSKKAESAE